MPRPSGEATERVEEIPQEIPLSWYDTETMTHTLLNRGDQVDMVYEDHADP